jgi:hypothetical protein
MALEKAGLEAAGFPVPPMKGDRIVLAGNRVTTITAVDHDHREYLGCYDITAAGA